MPFLRLLLLTSGNIIVLEYDKTDVIYNYALLAA